jgi:hypothetical protein
MKSKIILSVLFGVMGCDLFQYEDFRYYPNGLDATFLTSYRLISYTKDEVVYEVDLASWNYYNNVYFGSTDDYELTGNGTLSILNLSNKDNYAVGTSSTVLLLDQSGSYSATDPYNYRIKIVNKFLEDIGSPHDFILGAFSSQGLLTQEPVEYNSNEFILQWENRDFLFELAKRTGGKSSLYDAINSAMDKLSASPSAKRNLIVLTHANDGGSTASLSDLIAKAVSNSIKVHIIILGPEPLPSSLWELSQQSQGMFAPCPEDLRMVTLFGHLAEFLNDWHLVTTLRIKFQPNGGNVVSGNVYENQVRVLNDFLSYTINPVYVKIKIP